MVSIAFKYGLTLELPGPYQGQVSPGPHPKIGKVWKSCPFPGREDLATALYTWLALLNMVAKYKYLFEWSKLFWPWPPPEYICESYSESRWKSSIVLLCSFNRVLIILLNFSKKYLHHKVYYFELYFIKNKKISTFIDLVYRGRVGLRSSRVGYVLSNCSSLEIKLTQILQTKSWRLPTTTGLFLHCSTVSFAKLRICHRQSRFA